MRTSHQSRRSYSVVVLAVAVAVVAAGCATPASPLSSHASTPTLVSAAAPTASPTTAAATARPTLPEATPTVPTQPLPAATPTPMAAISTPPAVATSQSAPTSDSATPDRPFGPRTKDTGCSAHDGLPDGACTPGAVFPDVTAAQVCQRGYSSSVRDVPAEISREVYREYGIAQRTPGEYELDHPVPLEVGGSNDIANLWPEAAEPRPGFHEKDRVENYLHDQVCAGAMSLMEAQRAIATNWLDVYQHLPQRASATAVPTLAPAPQPGSASGVEITSIAGARPGGRATVAVQTTPGASCSISYRTPAGTSSTAQGLEAKAADAQGMVSWTWNIGQSTRPGTGTVVVTCNGASTSSPIQIGAVLQEAHDRAVAVAVGRQVREEAAYPVGGEDLWERLVMPE